MFQATSLPVYFIASPSFLSPVFPNFHYQLIIVNLVSILFRNRLLVFHAFTMLSLGETPFSCIPDPFLKVGETIKSLIQFHTFVPFRKFPSPVFFLGTLPLFTTLLHLPITPCCTPSLVLLLPGLMQ